jgi:hypothetical protein
MPGGITLLESNPTNIPTPGVNKDTIFIDNTIVPPAPSYKDSSGITRPLVSTGSTGVQGSPGVSIFVEDGLTGEDGIPGPPGVAGASGASSTLLTATHLLTAAELRSLNTVPIQLVAAPGSGFSLFPLCLIMEKSVSVGFSGTGGSIIIVYAGQTVDLLNPGAVSLALSSVATAIYTKPINTGVTAGSLVGYSNSALNIKSGADITGGTGDVWVTLSYMKCTIH